MKPAYSVRMGRHPGSKGKPSYKEQMNQPIVKTPPMIPTKQK